MILSFWNEIGLGHYLGLAALLFVIGLMTVLARRSPLASWMGILVMLEASVLNLCAFDRLGPVRAEAGEGRTFAVLVLSAGGVQTALAFAVLVQLVRTTGRGDLDAETATPTIASPAARAEGGS